MFRPNPRLLMRISASLGPARAGQMRRSLQCALLRSRLRTAASTSSITSAQSRQMHSVASRFVACRAGLTAAPAAVRTTGLLRRAGVVPVAAASANATSLVLAARGFSFFSTTRPLMTGKDGQANKAKTDNQLQGVHNLDRYRGEEEEERNERNEEEDPFGNGNREGYLPFPPPFHTVNVIMVIIICNVLCYLLMRSGNTDIQDFLVENFTLSHENAYKIYPLFTNALYQENLLQLVIDIWLLWQFGDTMLNFLGNKRMTFFAVMCTLCGSFLHLARQYFELSYGMDELEVRGRCYGSNPLIMGFISVEGLIFRHLNFIQQPPIPFLVLTAFVMVIDVWRIFTTKPEEHGAATGGALVAYILWVLPTRFMGLDRLTATF